jgi:hypothetical protein
MMSFQAVLVLAALGTNGSTDMVSLIDAPAYFKSRSIEVRADKLLALAEKTPEGNKEAIVQLLAIRWLGEHPAMVKKTENGRDLLRQIADGKKGKDPYGFAADYATLALARIDGKPVVLRTLPPKSVSADALQWFPKECTIFGSFDSRPPRGVTFNVDPQQQIRKLMSKEMRDRDREEMYSFAEKVGNFRVDRISFGVIPDMNDDSATRLFIRLTGKGDRKGLVDFISKAMGQAQPKERKGTKGEKITIIEMTRGGPAFGFVGNHDLLMCGYPGGSRGPNQKGKDLAVLEEALEVWAGKKTNILTGSYKGTLTRSSLTRANGLLLGDIPENWRKGATSRGSPFRGFPQHVDITLTRKPKTVRILFKGSAENAKEAKAFADSVMELKRKGLEGLKKLSEMKLPEFIRPEMIKSLTAALKTGKMEASDALLTGSITLSNEAAQAVVEMVPALFFAHDVAKEPRPVEKKE